MKKTGFTLAEVLISLAIVGIIAAITIPQIVTAVEKRKVGPILGRAVEQIELGAQNLIQHFNDGRTDNNYITLLSDIPNLDVKMLASFFGASPVKRTFTENDVKDYVAYNPLWYLMPSVLAGDTIVTKEPEAYDDFVETYDYQMSGYDWTTGCPVDMNYVSLTVPTGYGYCGEGWNSQVHVMTCLSDSDLKNLSSGVNYVGRLCYPPSVITPSGCPDGQEIFLDSNDAAGCYTPCGAGLVEDYDNNGRPFCSPEEEPESEPEPITPNAPDPPPSPPDEQGESNPYLFRLNKLPTELYFVGGIKNATKPSDVIARILVDYNGTKVKPNTVGKDIYEFDLLNNGKLKAYDNFAKEIVKNGFKTE